MLIVGDAGVRVRPVSQDFAKEADADISNEMPGLAKKAAGFFVAAFAAVKIGGFLKDSITEASDLSESASKVGVVFGGASDRVTAFAANASASLGQSNAQVLAATGTFGNLLRSVGLTEDKSADLSTSMVGLASDLASFNNTDPTVALDALRSGLLGETEPLKQFGVNLNAAAIEAEAVKLGLMEQGGTLTDAAKAQAAYSLIMQQTTLAQGDFARTSQGLANQQRVIAAQFTDLKANVGSVLVPFVQLGANVISGTVMPALLALTSGLPAVGTALGNVGQMWHAGFDDGPDAVNAATEGLSGLPFIIGQVAGTAGDLGAIFQESLADGAAGAALLAEDSLQGMAARAGVNFSFLGGLFQSTWSTLYSSLAPVIGPVVDMISSAFGTIGSTIAGAFPGGGGGGGAAFTFLTGLQSVIGGVLPLIIDYFTRWASVVQAVIPIVVTILQGLLPVVVDVFGQIVPVLQSLIPVVTQVAGVFATTLLTVIQALAPVIPPLVAAIGQVVSVLAGAFLGVLQALAPVLPILVTAIGQIASALATGLASALQAVIPILPVIAQVLGTVAQMLAGALASALQTVIPVIVALVPPLVQVATVIIGAVMQALQALLPIIPSLVAVFLQLIQAAVVPLLPILPLLANLVATLVAAIVPLIPTAVQVIAMLIQLAVSALLPLMPIITTVANLITMLIGVLVPIIQVLVTIVGAFLNFGAQIISVVVGLVSTVGQVFFGLIGVVTSIFGGIFSVISGVWNSVFGFVSGIVSRIAGAISGAFSGVAGAISGVFSGIAGGVESAFSGIGGAIRGIINGAIGVINSGIGFINRNLIDNANKVPFVDIPHIPNIPRLHTGGTFWSGSPSGEGFALLRDDETVVTPEDRDRAAALIVAATGGMPARPRTTSSSSEAQGISVVNNITQLPGESGTVLAARVNQDTIWNLNNGTRRVGVGS